MATLLIGLVAVLCALAGGWVAPAEAAQVQPARVSRVVGTSIEIVDAAGVARTGSDLTGFELALGDEPAIRLRIVSAVKDPAPGVWLHEIETQDPAGHWQNVCGVDRDHRQLALFIEGHDTPDGQQIRVPGQVSITCTAGVQGKCLRAGYRPWDDSHGPGSGNELFQTCTRMFRADYCGDGLGWTKNGQVIDIFDVYKIQRAEEPAGLPLEAAWGPNGAVCVHHTRVLEHGDLSAVLALCPRLASVPLGARCSEPTALGMAGALLFNRSADQSAGR